MSAVTAPVFLRQISFTRVSCFTSSALFFCLCTRVLFCLVVWKCALPGLGPGSGSSACRVPTTAWGTVTWLSCVCSQFTWQSPCGPRDVPHGWCSPTTFVLLEVPRPVPGVCWLHLLSFLGICPPHTISHLPSCQQFGQLSLRILHTQDSFVCFPRFLLGVTNQ